MNSFLNFCYLYLFPKNILEKTRYIKLRFRFIEITDVFYTKHAMASKKGAIKKDALYDFESILVSALVSKGKRSEA